MQAIFTHPQLDRVRHRSHRELIMGKMANEPPISTQTPKDKAYMRASDVGIELARGQQREVT